MTAATTPAVLAYAESPMPRLARDWPGGIVRLLRPMRNGWGEIPAGTLMRVTHRTSKVSLEKPPCACCGLTARITLDPTSLPYSIEWVGREIPPTS